MKSLKEFDISIAAELISRIDSGEMRLMTESYENENFIDAVMFSTPHGVCIYYSFEYFGHVRIQIAAEDDSSVDTDTIIKMLYDSFNKKQCEIAQIWVWHDNKRITDAVSMEFPSDDRPYASIEYMMYRKNYTPAKRADDTVFKRFDKSKIRDYLILLDDSMTFDGIPGRRLEKIDGYIKKFSEKDQYGGFEALWTDEKLVGLYWRKRNEIEVIAVHPDFHRMGYGTRILDRAIDMIFNMTEYDNAYLYCVDWNPKGHRFYKAYGMKAAAHAFNIRVKLT